MSSPPFDAIFGAPNNCLDLPEALNSGKIVLINLDRDFLEKEPSGILGKWFVAQTYRAALRRANVPEHRRRPAYLVVDEASPYFDEQTEDVLRTMRSYRVGAVLAFQDFAPVADTLKSAMYGNTSIKMAGGKSTLDARILADPLHTTPEFILSRQKVDHGFSEFACYVDRVTPAAVSLRIPHGTLDAQPRMSDDQYRRLRATNKQAMTRGPSPALTPPPASPIAPPTAPPAALPAAPTPGDSDDHTKLG
jgi:hypothetical protein